MRSPYCRFHFLLAMVLTFVAESRSWGQEKGPARWEKEIVAIEHRIVTGKIAEGAPLFLGSSSIRLWKLEESFPELNALNHGFGGSVLSDSTHYFDRIVLPVKPSVIVLYAGDNDIASGKSPETVRDDFKTFSAMVEEKVPDCRQVIFISIKPSIKRWALAEKIQKANRLIEQMCVGNSRLKYLDVWKPMLTEDGQPNADLLLDDGLHMNEKGYKIWTDALIPCLR